MRKGKFLFNYLFCGIGLFFIGISFLGNLCVIFCPWEFMCLCHHFLDFGWILLWFAGFASNFWWLTGCRCFCWNLWAVVLFCIIFDWVKIFCVILHGRCLRLLWKIVWYLLRLSGIRSLGLDWGKLGLDYLIILYMEFSMFHPILTY